MGTIFHCLGSAVQKLSVVDRDDNPLSGIGGPKLSVVDRDDNPLSVPDFYNGRLAPELGVGRMVENADRRGAGTSGGAGEDVGRPVEGTARLRGSVGAEAEAGIAE